MYRPFSGLWFFQLLAGAAAGVVMLWRRPDTPLSPRAKTVHLVAAITIATVALAAGGFFSVITFAETDSWARWMTARLSFGIFGFPSSFLAIAAAALIKKTGGTQAAAESVLPVFLAISFFAQWLLVAALLFRRSRF